MIDSQMFVSMRENVKATEEFLFILHRLDPFEKTLAVLGAVNNMSLGKTGSSINTTHLAI